MTVNQGLTEIANHWVAGQARNDKNNLHTRAENTH